jgi:hypothetical protein
MFCIGATQPCAACTKAGTEVARSHGQRGRHDVVRRRPAPSSASPARWRAPSASVQRAGVGDHGPVARARSATSFTSAPPRTRHGLLEALEGRRAFGRAVARRRRWAPPPRCRGPARPGRCSVKPQARRGFCPSTTPGSPGMVAPATSSARGLQPREVPQRRRVQAQVRVVGQQRACRWWCGCRPAPSCSSPRPRTPEGGAVSGQLQPRLPHRAAGSGRARGTAPRSRAPAAARRPDTAAGTASMRATGSRADRRSRCISAGPVAAQVPGHHERPGQAVYGFPGLGLHAQEQELRRPCAQRAREHRRSRRRCRPPAPARALGGGALPLRLRGTAHAQARAGSGRCSGAAGPKASGQAAGADAPVRLHLPQPVLGVHDPEAEEGVVAGCRRGWWGCRARRARCAPRPSGPGSCERAVGAPARRARPYPAAASTATISSPTTSQAARTTHRTRGPPSRAAHSRQAP